VKFGVFYKWLLSLLLTLTLVIVVILAVVNWSFQQGFVSYVRQNEIQQVNRVGTLLIDEYARQGSWNFLYREKRSWPRFLESAGIQVPPQMSTLPPPPPEGVRTPPRQDQPQSDLLTASVPLAHRIVLQDANRQRIVGPRIPIRDEYWYALENQGQVVGWIGLQPIEIVTDQLAHSFIAQQRTSYAWISLAGVLLALLLATVWARWFLRPIHQVMTGARQLASGHYDTRVPEQGNSELAELARNFNQLARTLARNDQMRRQWIVDISHELRTPIAIIGGEVEAILDGIRQPTPERMNALHSEIGALGKLVDDLHLLSLADQATLELTPETLDLCHLVREQIRHFEPRMARQGLTLTLDTGTEERFILEADSRRLSQLLANLLENSLRYTDPQGQVRILLRSGRDHITLEIQDSPPGVADAELEKIFARLYRVDRSRSRALGGSGLGLAICREIVVAHGGSISAGRSPLGGLLIRVRLPRTIHSG